MNVITTTFEDDDTKKYFVVHDKKWLLTTKFVKVNREHSQIMQGTKDILFQL